jgi:hypothetical protein
MAHVCENLAFLTHTAFVLSAKLQQQGTHSQQFNLHHAMEKSTQSKAGQKKFTRACQVRVMSK